MTLKDMAIKQFPGTFFFDDLDEAIIGFNQSTDESNEYAIVLYSEEKAIEILKQRFVNLVNDHVARNLAADYLQHNLIGKHGPRSPIFI